MKKIISFLIWIAGGIIALSLILFLIVLIKSPGKPRPFIDRYGQPVPGSIALIEKVDINGVEQGMIIRGRDTTKPVLLYLHGGPGSPEFPFIRQFNSAIEHHFVVCYWDQRGSGLSYSSDIAPESITLDQFTEDAAEVSRYLKQRFSREKIYLFGHSWGSLLGSHTAAKYPELFYAYISTGQVAEQLRAEQISYDFVLAKAEELGDKKGIENLKEIGRPPYDEEENSMEKVMMERRYVTKYGGAVREGNFYREAVIALLECREYTISDKINYFRGMSFVMPRLWAEVMASDLFSQVPEQTIPVYIVQGLWDYQTAYVVAKEYFDALEAPVKEFYTFENSAHSPIFEEPMRFEEIIEEIINETEQAGK